MANALHIDFETRGVLDLRTVGLHRYARDPDTDVWCLASALDEAEPSILPIVNREAALPAEVAAHVEAGGAVYAHNAPFELEIWNQILVPRYGWPMLRPEQTYCTMAMAYAMSLPGALEDAALALGLHVLKDAEGRSLMLRMARPRSKPGQPLVWWDEPEKLARLYAYCQQDVRVERELHKRLMPLSDKERRVWLLDYKINQRGVRADIPTARAGVQMAEALKEQYNARLAKVTQGAVTAGTAVAALKEWMASKGVVADSLAKQAVVDLLADDALAPDIREALRLRQEIGRASTAKLTPMIEIAGIDDRLRNTTQYHGASTGRWAGRKVQPHNFPREVPKGPVLNKIMELIRAGAIDVIDTLYGAPMEMLSKCLRGFFIPAEGNVFTVGDFANVEGRGVAWFSGEHWKIKAFQAADDKTGPGLYELAYSKSFGVPVESVLNPSFERQVGKVMELAFGYQGGVGSFHSMAKNYGVKVSDAQADEFKVNWRAAHPATRATWYALQNAAINAVLTPGNIYTAGFTGREVKFKVAGSFLWCLLPSGRALCYPYPKLVDGSYGPQLTYMTVPQPTDKAKGKIIYDVKNANNWARLATYGGALMENVIQAICRDLLVESMLALDALGLPIVMHVHDEVLVEIPADMGTVARGQHERIMRTAPKWAAGFPLFADVKIMEARYGK